MRPSFASGRQTLRTLEHVEHHLLAQSRWHAAALHVNLLRSLQALWRTFVMFTGARHTAAGRVCLPLAESACPANAEWSVEKHSRFAMCRLLMGVLSGSPALA